MKALLFVAVFCFHGLLCAQTLTASCKEPAGRALGVLGQNNSVDDTESMKGGVLTLSWKIGQPKASIVINTGTAGSVSSVEGVLVFRTDEQLTFFASFPGAAYMISLFVTPKRLLISSHQPFLGFVAGSALAKTFQATCETTFQ